MPKLTFVNPDGSRLEVDAPGTFDLRLTVRDERGLESLDTPESHVLITPKDLSVLLRTERIFLYPWQRSTPIDYRVRVEVTRFAAGPEPKVHLRCRWTLANAAGKPIHSQVSRLEEPADLGDYTDIVAAMSRSVEALARQVAARVPPPGS